MDPITAILNTITAATGLVSELVKLETVTRQNENPKLKEAREEMTTHAYEIGTFGLKQILKLLRQDQAKDKPNG